MARPPKPIDWDRVEKMMWAGLTGTEIAGRFNLHHDTFYDRFQKQYNTSFASVALYDRETGNGYLREKQFNEAMNGNNHQLTKLCEVRLGQGKGSENTESDLRGSIILAQELKETRSTLHPGGAVMPTFPDEQSLSHQRPAGEKDPLSNELGTENTMEREAQL